MRHCTHAALAGMLTDASTQPAIQLQPRPEDPSVMYDSILGAMASYLRGALVLSKCGSILTTFVTIWQACCGPVVTSNILNNLAPGYRKA